MVDPVMVVAPVELLQAIAILPKALAQFESRRPSNKRREDFEELEIYVNMIAAVARGLLSKENRIVVEELDRRDIEFQERYES